MLINRGQCGSHSHGKYNIEKHLALAFDFFVGIFFLPVQMNREKNEAIQKNESNMSCRTSTDIQWNKFEKKNEIHLAHSCMILFVFLHKDYNMHNYA